MKRFFPLFVFILFPLAVCSKEIKTLNARDVENENFSYDNTILELKDVSEPLEKGNHIIFTAKHNVRFVGIAFDFEEYKKIHPFKIHSTYDIDNNKTGSLMFYVLAKPKGVSSVSYRLIVDGIWTTDPTNPDSYFDENLGLQLSRIKFSTTIQSEINSSANKNGTHFVYEGRPGQKIYVSGTFSNWDPWIYEM
ncbi:MAG: hypothetical protein IKI31_03165, partial [Treponema sp.]|nr:hypothetical protein [Treponema sp.]